MTVMCERCGRPVTAARQWRDHRTFETVFRVECHGEIEETRIGDATLQDGPIKIVSAVAFRLRPALNGVG